MSVESISWALNLEDDRLTPVDRLVLIGIANHDGDGGAWPAMATLARYAGVAPRSARRSVTRLTEFGLVVRHEQQGGSHRTRADQRPNLYELVKSPPDTTVPPSEREDTTVPPREDPPVPPPRTDGSSEPSMNRPHEPSEPPVVPQGGPSVDEIFEVWWKPYPRKVGKPAAFRAFKAKAKALGRVDLRDFVFRGTAAWIEHWRLAGTEEQYIPHPSTFLNQERYNDPVPTRIVKKETGMDALRRLAERDQEPAS